MARVLLTALIDRFKGAAVGTFVGDAMGREVEGWSWEMIRARYGLLQEVGEGIYTDDTEMMIGIMESLQEDPRFDPALTAQKFLTNFHPFRGYGARIYGVMARLRRGMSWDQVGTDSWGNGGAMRIAPIGFFFYDDRDRLTRNALLCTQITHKHPQGLAGALAQALAVGIAVEKGMKGEDIDTLAFLEEIARRVQDVDPHMAAELGRVGEIDRGGELEERIGRVAFSFLRDVSAAGAVPAAIASFVLNDNLRDTVVTAVNCGGDTDTIGAMAGAIAGAYYGFSSIPPKWLSCLENGEKGRDYVTSLAEQLALIKAQHKGWI